MIAKLFRNWMVVLAALCLILTFTGCAGGNGNGGEDKETTESTTETTVIVDTQAPVIYGVVDQTHYQNETVDFLKGVTAVDDLDDAPTVTVDASALSQGHPGVYTVVYTATDAAGNTARATATVTVLAWKEGNYTIDEVFAMVDKELASIWNEYKITDASTDREKVVAIHKWARKYWFYNKDFDNSQYDLYQGAAYMLNNYNSDCYGYFAATKLMFERLGFENIDVRKVKPYPEANNHYWSLVSVDGGKTYYHFDATPRIGGFDGCLMTDAALDAYSLAHKKSHNRDMSLYPATPES